MPGASDALDAVRPPVSRVVSSVLFYWFVSLSLVFLNKSILRDYAFPYPLSVLWYQLILSLVCLWLFGEVGKHVPALSFVPPFSVQADTARQVAPLTLVFVGMIASSNLCLQHVDVAFYQVARSLTICFSIALSYAFLGVRTSARAVVCCLVVVAGFLIGSTAHLGAQEGATPRFSALGIAFGVLGSIFVASYSLLVKRYLGLPTLAGDTWRLMQYNSAMAVPVLLPVLWSSGELQGALASEQLHSARFWLLNSVTAFFGFLITIAMFWQIKYTSALSNNVSGTVKAALQTMIAVVVLGEPLDARTALGVALVIGGSFAYSQVRYAEMQAKDGDGKANR